MLSSFVAVEMTSHQNSPLYFDSIPAWINMALALPINVGILLSATEFCWGVPGAVNSKVIPRSVSSSADLLERTYDHEYPVSRSGW